jgi:hypothetical protein
LNEEDFAFEEINISEANFAKSEEIILVDFDTTPGKPTEDNKSESIKKQEIIEEEEKDVSKNNQLEEKPLKKRDGKLEEKRSLNNKKKTKRSEKALD